MSFLASENLMLSHFCAVLLMKVRLNEGSYTAGLMACEKGGQWALALELLKEMHLVNTTPISFIIMSFFNVYQALFMSMRSFYGACPDTSTSDLYPPVPRRPLSPSSRVLLCRSGGHQP
jgi:hypothetical protein